ncbi:Peptidase family S58 [compost metagenome]
MVATDAPLDARQLRRLALRAGAGLARTGSVFGHGSGDIVLAFSTAYTVPDRTDRPMPAIAMLHDGLLDGLFQAAADSTEQAILHALWRATAVTGRDGHHRAALSELLPPSSLLLSSSFAQPHSLS